MVRIYLSDMKKAAIILIAILLCAGHGKYYVRIDKHETAIFPGIKGDTGLCEYNVKVHYFKCKTPLHQALNKFTLENAFNKYIPAGPVTEADFKNYVQKNWEAFKGEFAIVNTELQAAGAVTYKKISESNILYQSKKYFVYGIYNQFITGNPNPYFYRTYQVLNAKTGVQVPWQSLFNDTLAIANIAQEHFRTQQNVEKGAPLSHAGWFYNGQFYLSKNYFFDKDNICFHYNIYEIAQYSDGETTIKVPLTEVKHLLKNSLK